MLKMAIYITCAAFFAVLVSACVSGGGAKGVDTAEGVNLQKYMGKWYEIARYDNWFQKGLINSEAQYTLEGDKVVVVNSARNPDGTCKTAKGRAYAPDASDPSKLRVSFFWPFYADYYILELAPDYSWSLVGSSDKGYLWILSRTKSMPKAELDKVLLLAKSRGYDTSKLIYSQNQTKGAEAGGDEER